MAIFKKLRQLKRKKAQNKKALSFFKERSSKTTYAKYLFNRYPKTFFPHKKILQYFTYS